MKTVLYDLWLRLWAAGWFDFLPESLREPPQIWAVLLILAAIGLGVLWWIVAAFWRRITGRVRGAAGARELLAEPKAMLKEGQFLEAGQAFEALGKTSKALKAYEQGECHEARASLLLHLGDRKKARKVAAEGGVWRLYAEICQEDGDVSEAAVAFERAGQAYLAGQCYAQLEQPLDAARCYLAAGMEAEAVKLLGTSEDPQAAEVLDQAVRNAMMQTGAAGLSLELQDAVQRGVQMWLGRGEADKAFRLAVDAERFRLAVPIARDYLEPSLESADICARAGAHGVAADLYAGLGETRKEAIARAEDALSRNAPAEAAQHFEQAEEWAEAADQWAAAGESERAAALFDRVGDPMAAAQMRGTSLHVGPVPGIDPIPSAIGRPGDLDPRTEMDPRIGEVGDGDLTVPSSRPSPEALGVGLGDLTVPAGAQTRKPDMSPEATKMAMQGERYRIFEELGRGGMGAVYRAEDTVLQRQVAYKEIPKEMIGVGIEPESLLQEARAAARLSHPNIVQVYDAGRNQRGFYVVMELIRGQSLDAIAAEKQITLAGTVRLGIQVCAALDHAHKRQIVHRDLKPSNLMWSEEGVLKLADFGLARVLEAGKGRVVTQPAGTPSYMAPEQIRGEELSPAVDIYSFGCVLFELLCRESVFGAGPPSFHHHLSTPPRNPRQLRPDVPDPLANLVLQCLSKAPAERPASIAIVGQTLKSILPAVQ